MKKEPEIPWTRVAAFVRQHTHDVRNGLNCLDLETSLLCELVTDGEAQDSVKRVRGQVRAMADKMRSLAGRFQDPQPNPSPIAARELFLIWREQAAKLAQPPQVEWVDKLGDEEVNVDVEMIAGALRELVANAADFSQGGIATATARSEDGKVLFEILEPKSAPFDTTDWGHAFSTTRRGGYGLGLWSARRLIEANHATLMQGSGPNGGLLSRVSMPTA